MEYTAVFEESVSLTPKDLRGQMKGGLETILEGKIRARLEGKCSRHGYVVSDSVRLLSRSLGTMDRGRFTGNFLFHVQVEGKVLNPPDRAILEGEVIRKNKMGLYVNYKDAIRVIVPRDANIGKDEFDLVEVGEIITIEIKKSRFQVNDEYILSVGLFVGRKKSDQVVAAEAQESEGVESEGVESEGVESEGVESEEVESEEVESEESDTGVSAAKTPV